MEKSLKYSINGAWVAGICFGLINTFKQLYNKKEEDEFNWNELFKSAAVGATLGGTIGFVVGSIKENQIKNKITNSGNLKNYLKNKLNDYSVQNPYQLKIAELLKESLHNKFKEYLAEPPYFYGSISKGTSIVESDIDIHIKFKKSIGNLGEMRTHVFNYLQHEFKSIKLNEVREQKHSIGVFFHIGSEYKNIDIIPLREVENKRKDAYMSVLNTSFLTTNSTIKKTNVQIQSKVLKFSKKEQDLIKLLKIWKANENIKIKSIHLEFLVKKAFEKITFPNNNQSSFIKMIEFICNNIMNTRIIDPSNTSNIISNSITFEEKELVIESCLKLLRDVSLNKNYLVEYIK